MKVLVSCLSQSWGGMEMYTLTSLKKLREKNVEAELLCLNNSPLFNEAKNNNFKVYVSNVSGYLNFSEILKIKLLIQKNNYTHIHTHATKDLWVLVPALKFGNNNCKLLLTKHVGSFVVKKDPIHNFLYKHVDKAFAISNVIKNNLLETTNLKNEQISLLYDGIDLNKFNHAKGNREKIRNEFSIEENEIVIGIMGRFSPGKGHEEFISASEILASEFDNLKFMIVGEASKGEDEYGKIISSLVESSRYKNRFIFTGFRKDTPAILSAMDIFAFPSHAEAFGMALVEAMVMQLPSVCSNSDGVLDIALDGVTSYLFQKQNSNDLAEKIKLLINSKSKREQFGLAANERVINNFDLEVVTDQLINFYKTI